MAEYQTWVGEQVNLTIAATKTFTDAVRAGHLERAKAAYAPSRQGWERIEPIAGLVEQIDGAVDGQLDQGLAFVSFQRRLSQFLNTQARLAGEPLEEYILPEGGGFYFALPGVTGEGSFLGEGLVR